MATPARVMESARFAVRSALSTERAEVAWRETRRRRRVRGLAETITDAVMASGGLVLANAGLHLHMGLPEGRNGAALGGALLASGILWMTRHARSGRPSKDPATSARIPALVRIDTEAYRPAA